MFYIDGLAKKVEALLEGVDLKAESLLEKYPLTKFGQNHVRHASEIHTFSQFTHQEYCEYHDQQSPEHCPPLLKTNQLIPRVLDNDKPQDEISSSNSPVQPMATSYHHSPHLHIQSEHDWNSTDFQRDGWNDHHAMLQYDKDNVYLYKKPRELDGLIQQEARHVTKMASGDHLVVVLPCQKLEKNPGLTKLEGLKRSTSTMSSHPPRPSLMQPNKNVISNQYNDDIERSNMNTLILDNALSSSLTVDGRPPTQGFLSPNSTPNTSSNLIGSEDIDLMVRHESTMTKNEQFHNSKLENESKININNHSLFNHHRSKRHLFSHGENGRSSYSDEFYLKNASTSSPSSSTTYEKVPTIYDEPIRDDLQRSSDSTSRLITMLEEKANSLPSNSQFLFPTGVVDNCGSEQNPELREMTADNGIGNSAGVSYLTSPTAFDPDQFILQYNANLKQIEELERTRNQLENDIMLLRITNVQLQSDITSLIDTQKQLQIDSVADNQRLEAKVNLIIEEKAQLENELANLHQLHDQHVAKIKDRIFDLSQQLERQHVMLNEYKEKAKLVFEQKDHLIEELRSEIRAKEQQWNEMDSEKNKAEDVDRTMMMTSNRDGDDPTLVLNFIPTDDDGNDAMQSHSNPQDTLENLIQLSIRQNTVENLTSRLMTLEQELQQKEQLRLQWLDEKEQLKAELNHIRELKDTQIQCLNEQVRQAIATNSIYERLKVQVRDLSDQLIISNQENARLNMQISGTQDQDRFNGQRTIQHHHYHNKMVSMEPPPLALLNDQFPPSEANDSVRKRHLNWTHPNSSNIDQMNHYNFLDELEMEEKGLFSYSSNKYHSSKIIFTFIQLFSFPRRILELLRFRMFHLQLISTWKSKIWHLFINRTTKQAIILIYMVTLHFLILIMLFHLSR